MPARRFPPPWSVKELDACFVVRDQNGQQLASMRRMRAQADLEGKSLYAVCSRGGLGPDLFLIGLAANLPQ